MKYKVRIQKIIDFLEQYLRVVLDIVFPPCCIMCHKFISDKGLCSECWSKIDFISENSCYKCGIPIINSTNRQSLCGRCIINEPKYTRAFSVFVFNDQSKDLIHKFKYNDKTYLANLFAQWMARSIGEIIQDIDWIISVPIHRMKLLKRQYNQSSLLAKSLSKLIKVQFLPLCLIRTKNSVPQAGLTKKQRKKNVINVFNINPKNTKNIIGKNMLLIDDVYTTGATINECVSKLKAAGCNKIYILSLARTSL